MTHAGKPAKVAVAALMSKLIETLAAIIPQDRRQAAEEPPAAGAGRAKGGKPLPLRAPCASRRGPSPLPRRRAGPWPAAAPKPPPRRDGRRLLVVRAARLCAGASRGTSAMQAMPQLERELLLRKVRSNVADPPRSSATGTARAFRPHPARRLRCCPPQRPFHTGSRFSAKARAPSS